MYHGNRDIPSSIKAYGGRSRQNNSIIQYKHDLEDEFEFLYHKLTTYLWQLSLQES